MAPHNPASRVLTDACCPINELINSYKNLIADYKGHSGRLRKLLAAWSANAAAYVQRALEFEAEQAAQREAGRLREGSLEAANRALETVR